jgi:hypothetical protein
MMTEYRGMAVRSGDRVRASGSANARYFARCYRSAYGIRRIVLVFSLKHSATAPEARRPTPWDARPRTIHRETSGDEDLDPSEYFLPRVPLLAGLQSRIRGPYRTNNSADREHLSVPVSGVRYALLHVPGNHSDAPYRTVTLLARRRALQDDRILELAETTMCNLRCPILKQCDCAAEKPLCCISLFNLTSLPKASRIAENYREAHHVHPHLHRL